MIKEIIERIRQVIRKMLGKENIRDAIGVDVAVSDKMAREIDLWSKMYKNQPPWKRKELKLCGLPAAIAGEFARLVTLELKTEITGNKFLNDEYQTVIDNIRTYTEYACAKGGLAMKPYVSDGHIEVDMVQADRFFPVKFNSRGEVIAAVFMETVTIGKQVYSRAVDDIKEADYQWTRILWEFEGSELAIDGDVSLFKRKENGEFDLPKGKERLFRMMDFDDDKEQYKVFAPPIRDKSLINGFNAILRRVEFNSGLAYGTLSDLNTVDKTAEEIKTSKQRSYSTVSDIQKALQKALEQWM